jgi:hypothetical protein
MMALRAKIPMGLEDDFIQVTSLRAQFSRMVALFNRRFQNGVFDFDRQD